MNKCRERHFHGDSESTYVEYYIEELGEWRELAWVGKRWVNWGSTYVGWCCALFGKSGESHWIKTDQYYREHLRGLDSGLRIVYPGIIEEHGTRFPALAEFAEKRLLELGPEPELPSPEEGLIELYSKYCPSLNFRNWMYPTK